MIKQDETQPIKHVTGKVGNSSFLLLSKFYEVRPACAELRTGIARKPFQKRCFRQAGVTSHIPKTLCVTHKSIKNEQEK